jgi:putative ABC transport system permease protein
MSIFLHWAASLDAGLSSGAIGAFPAMGVVITFLLLSYPDLTIEGSFPFGAAVSAVLLSHGALHPAIVVVIAFLAGAAAGALTGLLHVRLGLGKLISGIAVAAMLYSASQLVMSGRANISLLDASTILSPV